MKSLIICLILSSIIGVSACQRAREIPNEYAGTIFQPQCIGMIQPDIMIMRVWGTGTSKKNALKDAEYNAIKSVLFSGITDGATSCGKKPLLPVPNTEDEYNNLIEKLLSDKKLYSLLVSVDKTKASQIYSKNAGIETWSVVININHSMLKDYLIQNNYIE